MANQDICAFDDCSILHMCKISIEPAFQIFFPDKELKHKNCTKLETLNLKLQKAGIKKYRFEPSNIERNVIIVVNDLLSSSGNVRMLKSVFMSRVIEQLDELRKNLTKDFDIINKGDNIAPVKNIFQSNVQQLRKDKNIPEDDDLKIIAGYQNFLFSGSKHLISEDEHFWGYKEVILQKFHINVIEEWNCDKISI